MKICTDIRQSQQLLKWGLEEKTADMYYPHLGEGTYGDTPRVGEPSLMYSGEPDIPAWSLSALLEQLPVYVISQFGKYHLNIERKEEVWKCSYCFYESSIGGDIYFAYSFVEDSFPAIEKPDLMDVIYEMVINYLEYIKNFLPYCEDCQK